MIELDLALLLSECHLTGLVNNLTAALQVHTLHHHVIFLGVIEW